MAQLDKRTFGALALALWMAGATAWAQGSPAAAAAAAGAGTSTSANGGTAGVGLGGAGPGATADDALVGPRARRQAEALLRDKPALQTEPPRNSGQRALMLDREQRAPARPPTPSNE